MDVLPGMNAGASTHAVPSPIEGSSTAWVLLGSWALSPARPTPIHPRRERRGLSALLGKRLGRPKGKLSSVTKLTGKDDLIREYLQKKIPQAVIARLLGVSHLTVRHYIRTRKLQKPAS